MCVRLGFFGEAQKLRRLERGLALWMGALGVAVAVFFAALAWKAWTGA